VASKAAAVFLLGGRAADHEKFGLLKELMEFRLRQETARIAELEKELEERKKKKAIEDLILENLSVGEMHTFLAGRKASEIAPPEHPGEEEELAEKEIVGSLPLRIQGNPRGIT
jgi:hypothetical protein